MYGSAAVYYRSRDFSGVRITEFSVANSRSSTSARCACSTVITEPIDTKIPTAKTAGTASAEALASRNSYCDRNDITIVNMNNGADAQNALSAYRRSCLTARLRCTNSFACAYGTQNSRIRADYIIGCILRVK